MHTDKNVVFSTGGTLNGANNPGGLHALHSVAGSERACIDL